MAGGGGKTSSSSLQVEFIVLNGKLVKKDLAFKRENDCESFYYSEAYDTGQQTRIKNNKLKTTCGTIISELMDEK